jgi:hypothetical protein
MSTTSFSCEYCGISFRSQNEKQEHIKLEHSEHKPPSGSGWFLIYLWTSNTFNKITYELIGYLNNYFYLHNNGKNVIKEYLYLFQCILINIKFIKLSRLKMQNGYNVIDIMLILIFNGEGIWSFSLNKITGFKIWDSNEVILII